MVVDPLSSVGLSPLPAFPPMTTQVVSPLEEFAEDVNQRLGGANGNIFQRRPGVEGSHDGQVMLRLQKKRFIVLDYSIVPNTHDFQYATRNEHINVPLGAGVTKCNGKIHQTTAGPSPAPTGLLTLKGGMLLPPPVLATSLVPTITAQCHKVGIPVLLYDSEPNNESTSLYLTSGLCFTCQRHKFKKRSTPPKEPVVRAANEEEFLLDALHGSTQVKYLLSSSSLLQWETSPIVLLLSTDLHSEPRPVNIIDTLGAGKTISSLIIKKRYRYWFPSSVSEQEYLVDIMNRICITKGFRVVVSSSATPKTKHIVPEKRLIVSCCRVMLARRQSKKRVSDGTFKTDRPLKVEDKCTFHMIFYQCSETKRWYIRKFGDGCKHHHGHSQLQSQQGHPKKSSAAVVPNTDLKRVLNQLDGENDNNNKNDNDNDSNSADCEDSIAIQDDDDDALNNTNDTPTEIDPDDTPITNGYALLQPKVLECTRMIVDAGSLAIANKYLSAMKAEP